MNINLNTLQLIFWILFFGGIFYYVTFRGPASDMIFSSDSSTEIDDVRKYLSENGIKTYVKNMSEYRNIMRYPGQPSLHVIDQNDKDKAIRLINRINT
jgi:hypothetical protein